MTSFQLAKQIKDLEHKLNQIIVNRCATFPTSYVGRIVIYDGDLYFWNGTTYNKVTTEADITSIIADELSWLTTDIQDSLVNATGLNGINYVVSQDQLQNALSNISIGTNIEVIDFYSNLPPASSSNTGEFYWVVNDEGTWWLPGNLGGTYYKKGLYYSTGTTWETAPVPYQATQAEVDVGTEPYKFVTPKTLKDSIQWNTKRDLYTWEYLLMNWSVEPTLNTAIVGGDVYNYTLNGTTRYRFVPTTYDPTQDAFYENFDGTNLTGLITARG